MRNIMNTMNIDKCILNHYQGSLMECECLDFMCAENSGTTHIGVTPYDRSPV